MNGATELKYTFKSEKEVAERVDAVFELLKYFEQSLVQNSTVDLSPKA